MIQARNIKLTVNGRDLLKAVDLDVTPGHFTAIAGPNGAGKSSLLKVMSGEQTKHTGEVSINGIPARRYSATDLALLRAVLPQSSHVQFAFNVRQIVEMGRQYHRSTSAKTKEVVEQVMDLTGILAWEGRNYLTLSGGEQQRVQLARVLAQVWENKTFPRYILLDEPTSSLDLAQQQLIFGLVKHACERNIGVLAIVHDLNQVTQFADRLYFLKDGSVVAGGKPTDVFKKHIIEETFCCRVNVYHDPCTNCPYIVPDNQTFEVPTKKVSI
jgi:iron complex transport system ATP-binding protein